MIIIFCLGVLAFLREKVTCLTIIAEWKNENNFRNHAWFRLRMTYSPARWFFWNSWTGAREPEFMDPGFLGGPRQLRDAASRGPDPLVQEAEGPFSFFRCRAVSPARQRKHFIFQFLIQCSHFCTLFSFPFLMPQDLYSNKHLVLTNTYCLLANSRLRYSREGDLQGFDHRFRRPHI